MSDEPKRHRIFRATPQWTTDQREWHYAIQSAVCVVGEEDKVSERGWVTGMTCGKEFAAGIAKQRGFTLPPLPHGRPKANAV